MEASIVTVDELGPADINLPMCKVCLTNRVPSNSRSLCYACLGFPERVEGKVEDKNDQPNLVCQEHGSYMPWKNGRSISLKCPICTQRKRQVSLAAAGARRTAAFNQRKQEEADRQAREKAEFEAFKASRNEQVNMWVSEGENGKLKVISPLGGMAELECDAQDDGQAESPVLLRESDFADYPRLLDNLRLKAKDDVRSLTQEIVFACKWFLMTKGHRDNTRECSGLALSKTDYDTQKTRKI